MHRSEWKEYQLPGSEIFINREKFLVTMNEPGRIELRNIRVTSPDKTEMMRFTFY
jgi:hypothetical protein